jgi:hypothetical protein
MMKKMKIKESNKNRVQRMNNNKKKTRKRAAERRKKLRCIERDR